MKRTYIYFFTIVFLMQGCQLTQRESTFMNDIDTLLTRYKELDSIVKADSLKYKEELQRIKSEASMHIDSLKNAYNNEEAKVKGIYHVIVGSFKYLENARNYMERMQVLGYNASMFKSRNDFYLVSSSSHSSLSAAKTSLAHATEALSAEAWIMKKGDR